MASVADPPPDFLCPISKELMRDPVLLVETGHTYERSALARWWSLGHYSCPKTGIQLSTLHVATNWTLRGAIESWVMAHPAAAAAAAASAAATEAAAVAAAAAAAANGGNPRAGVNPTGASGNSEAGGPPPDINSHPLTFDVEQLQALTLEDHHHAGAGRAGRPGQRNSTTAPSPSSSPDDMDCSSPGAPDAPPHALSGTCPQPGGAPHSVPPGLPDGAAAAAAAAQNVPPGVALLGSGGWTFFPGLDSPGGDIGQAPGLGPQGSEAHDAASATPSGPSGAPPAPGSLAAALAIAQSRLTVSGPSATGPVPCTCAAAAAAAAATAPGTAQGNQAVGPGAGAPPVDPAAVAAAACAPPGTTCRACGGVRGLAHPPGITLLSPAPPGVGPQDGQTAAPGGAASTAVISASSSHLDHWWLSAPIVAFNTNGWVKALLQPMHGWVKWTAEAGKGLFVRNDVLLALMQGVLAHMQGSQSAPVQLAGWTFFHGLDSLGGDVAWAWQHTGAPPQLARVASEMAGVIAFNTDGYLKTALHPRREWVAVEAWKDKPGSGLYVHNSILWKLLVAR